MYKTAVFHFRGRSSHYQHTFTPCLFPEDDDKKIFVGVTHFSTHFTLPNVTPSCSSFKIGAKKGGIHIPVGNYDLHELSNVLSEKSGGKIVITPLYAQRKVMLKCSEELDLSASTSIAPLLGFARKKFRANIDHVSENSFNSQAPRALNVSVEGAQGIYRNGAVSSCVLHQIITVPPNFEVRYDPKTPLFFPLASRNLTSLRVSVSGENHVSEDSISLEDWSSEFNIVLQLRRE
jgi:hypothetical protein